MNIGVYILKVTPPYFLRAAKKDGSVDSSGVSTIMRSVGQNPSEAEIAVWWGNC